MNLCKSCWLDKMVYCVAHVGFQRHQDERRGAGEAGEMEDQKGGFDYCNLVLCCFGSFVSPCLFCFKFYSEDTVWKRGEYGGTGAGWSELGYMIWNSQRFNKEIVLKARLYFTQVSPDDRNLFSCGIKTWWKNTILGAQHVKWWIRNKNYQQHCPVRGNSTKAKLISKSHKV